MKPILSVVLTMFAVAAARADDPKRYIILEVASSAVRTVVVDVPSIGPVFRQEEKGTNLVKSADGPAGMKVYPPEAIEKVVNAVAKMHAAATEKADGKPVIYGLFMSSGAAGVVTPASRDGLLDAIAARNLPGLTRERCTWNKPADEVRLSFLGAVPADRRATAIALDVGSGDTKCGFAVADATGGWAMTVVSVQAGSKSPATDAILADLRTKWTATFADSPRDTVYVTGGMGWAMAGLELPAELKNPTGMAEVTDPGVVDRFLATAAVDGLPPAKDATPAAKDAAGAIAGAFKPAELMAGSKLLSESLTTLRAYKPAGGSPRKLVLVHDSLFINLVGYANQLAQPTPRPDAPAKPDAVLKSIDDGFQKVADQLRDAQANTATKADVKRLADEVAALREMIQNLQKTQPGTVPPPASGTAPLDRVKDKQSRADPSAAQTEFHRGMDVYHGSPDRALTHFQAAVGANDAEPTYWYALALAQSRLGHSAEVRASADRLARFQAADSRVLARVAPAFERVQGGDRVAVEAAIESARYGLRR